MKYSIKVAQLQYLSKCTDVQMCYKGKTLLYGGVLGMSSGASQLCSLVLWQQMLAPLWLVFSLSVSPGWRQAATGSSRWMIWWSWVVNQTLCVSSLTSSPSTTTCASLSEAQKQRISSVACFSLQTHPLLHSMCPTWADWDPELAWEQLWKD